MLVLVVSSLVVLLVVGYVLLCYYRLYVTNVSKYKRIVQECILTCAEAAEVKNPFRAYVMVQNSQTTIHTLLDVVDNIHTLVDCDLDEVLSIMYTQEKEIRQYLKKKAHPILDHV